MTAESHFILFGSIGGFSYAAVFMTALLAGYLIPLPEEIVFILVGYGIVFTDLNIYLVILASVLGIMVSDNVAFWLGLKGGALVGKFKRRVNQEQIAKYEGLIRRFAGKTIFTARFLPTLRVLVPILAGTLKVSWRTFFFYDLLATIIDVSLLILIGFIFDGRIASVLRTAGSVQHGLSIISLVIIGAIISLVGRALFFKKG